MENVRRYRAIASLYRQTAAFRPHQRSSLLAQAAEWEQLAVAELEAYFEACDDALYGRALYGQPARLPPPAGQPRQTQPCEMMAA